MSAFEKWIGTQERSGYWLALDAFIAGIRRAADHGHAYLGTLTITASEYRIARQVLDEIEAAADKEESSTTGEGPP